MRINIINHLVCPICHGDLLPSAYKKTKERIIEGELKCKKCGKKFHIRNGIAYFDSCRKKRLGSAQELRKMTIEQEIPKKWMRLLSKPELAALKKEWQWMLSSIKKSKNAIHLDFATGPGRFLRYLIPRTKGEIVALDNGYGTCQELQYLLKRIRKYKRVSIICADARKMPFRNGVFDSVSSWHGLDEVKMKDSVREARRVLKKGGYFVTSGVHYQKGSKSFQRARKYHINFLTREETIRTLKAVSFRKIEHKILYKGCWNEKESSLPIFGDLYFVYAVKSKK